MSSLDPLTIGASRLSFLPEGMNWRGLWDVTTQYYNNDVVYSPTNGESYVLTLPTLGGLDPALAPFPSVWIPTSGGAGAYISGTFTLPARGVANVPASTQITALQTFTLQSGIYSLSASVAIPNDGLGAPPLATSFACLQPYDTAVPVPRYEVIGSSSSQCLTLASPSSLNTNQPYYVGWSGKLLVSAPVALRFWLTFTGSAPDAYFNNPLTATISAVVKKEG